jgi:hypothetical protein
MTTATRPVRIDRVIFKSFERRCRSTLSHPVGTVKSTGLVEEVALFSRTAAKGDLQIAVTVTRLDPEIKVVRVRALRVGADRTIGNVRETVVRFRNDTETVTARVQHSLASASVQVIPVQWDWFVLGERSGRWAPLHFSNVISVYTTVGTPQPPWGPFRDEQMEIPWREALDRACLWAQGARNIEQVARLITKAVYEIRTLHYDGRHDNYVSPDQTYPPSPNYIPTFDCQEFLESLMRRDGNSLGCPDVASIVCTLSNILGANLYEDKMGTPGLASKFRTVKVRGIGWKYLEPPSRRRARPLTFSWHEVAWNYPGGESQAVWDAAFSRVTSGKERLAIRVRFKDYCRLVIANSDQPEVSPNDTPPMRRVIKKPDAYGPDPQSYAVNHPINDLKLPGWRLVRPRIEVLPSDAIRQSSFWTAVGSKNRQRLRRMSIQLLELKTESQAVGMLILMTKTSAVSLSRLGHWESSNEAFGIASERDHESLIYLRQGNVIARISSTGMQEASIRKEAEAVAKQLSKVVTPPFPPVLRNLT